MSAIGNKMKNGKEGGSSGILAEMAKEVSGEDEFLDVWLDCCGRKAVFPRIGRLLF